jgi:hypothetical protein
VLASSAPFVQNGLRSNMQPAVAVLRALEKHLCMTIYNERHLSHIKLLPHLFVQQGFIFRASYRLMSTSTQSHSRRKHPMRIYPPVCSMKACDKSFTTPPSGGVTIMLVHMMSKLITFGLWQKA